MGQTVLDRPEEIAKSWTDECEELLAEWSEKASCYRWLHGRSEKNYKTWYYGFSIPVIILSTLTGAANVGMDSFVSSENKAFASAIVGGVNIFAGIISTLQNFLKVAELMESNRIAGISWGKLQRNIAIELALDPSRRTLQGDFLKISRAEYDRLIEAGPIIDDGVIKLFNKKFKNYKIDNDISVPSICNGLDKCNIYKIDKTIKMNESDFHDGIESVISNEIDIMNEDQLTPLIIVDNNTPDPDPDQDPSLVPDPDQEPSADTADPDPDPDPDPVPDQEPSADTADPDPDPDPDTINKKDDPVIYRFNP